MGRRDVASLVRRHSLGEKVIEETILLRRPRHGVRLREEVWQSVDGEVTKYNYDNSHDCHHRHFMGEVQGIQFTEDFCG